MLQGQVYNGPIPLILATSQTCLRSLASCIQYTVFLIIHASLPNLEMIDLGSLATMFPTSVEAVRSEARP